MAKKKNDPWAGVVWTTTPQPGDEILQSLPGRRGYGYKGGRTGSPGASPIAVRRGAGFAGPAVIPDRYAGFAGPAVIPDRYAGFASPAVIPDRYSVATKPAKPTRKIAAHVKTRPAAARRSAKSMTPAGIRAEGIRIGQAAHSATSHPLPPEVLQTAKERPSRTMIDDLLSDSQRHREEQEKLYPITHRTSRHVDYSAKVDTLLGDTLTGRMLKEARINSLLKKTEAGDLANKMSLNNLIEKSMSERSKIEKLLRSPEDYKERVAELLNSTPKPKKKKKKKKNKK